MAQASGCRKGALHATVTRLLTPPWGLMGTPGAPGSTNLASGRARRVGRGMCQMVCLGGKEACW